MHEFVWLAPLLGGVLIGLAATVLLLANGQVAGISGIIGGLLRPQPGDTAWRAWFLAGLLAAGLGALLIAPAAFGSAPRSLVALALAGVLVGVGTRLGGGCTSGHGVCGISRFSIRSVLATLTFIGTGVITVAVLRFLGVGS